MFKFLTETLALASAINYENPRLIMPLPQITALQPAIIQQATKDINIPNLPPQIHVLHLSPQKTLVMES